jgi:hypothetical protein
MIRDLNSISIFLKTGHCEEIEILEYKFKSLSHNKNEV